MNIDIKHIAKLARLRIEDGNYTKAIPAYLCILSMPLFYSISEGISLGIISYVVINLICGKRKEIHKTGAYAERSSGKGRLSCRA